MTVNQDLIVQGGIAYILIKEVIAPLIGLLKNKRNGDDYSNANKILFKVGENIKDLNNSLTLLANNNTRDHEEIKTEIMRIQK